MITLNAIAKRLEQFGTNHFFIKSYSFGSPDDVDLDKFQDFPLMHVVYTGSDYDERTKTFSFEVYVFDRPNREEQMTINQREVVSDAQQCLEDVIADIANGGNIFLFDEDYEVTTAGITPLIDERSNLLTGALLDLTIQVPYQRDACNLPIDGVQSAGGEIAYRRRGILRIRTQDGTTDVQSVNEIRVTNGTLTDEGNGVVSIDTGSATIETLNDIGDVNVPEPLDRQALTYDEATGEWIADGVGQVVIPVRNNSPSQTLNKGLIVAFAGTQGDRILVEPWDNASPSAYIVGVLSENLAGGADGHAQTYGEIRALNTSDYALDTVLYASGGGTFTTTANSLPVATVTRVHANTGRIFVRLYVPGDHYRDRFRAEATAAATAHSVAPAQVETYYTAQANGDGFRQAPGSDTPRNEGDVVRRTIYWKAGAFAAINASGYTEIVLADDATYAQLLAAIDDILNANGAPITIWSKREEVTPSQGLLNDYPGAAAAYSLRLLDADYSGSAINVRRASDNAVQDIGFDANGDLDTSALATFCAGTDGYVVRWYDQSGGGLDLVQATTAKQAQIVASGSVLTQNGISEISFAGSKVMTAGTVSDWNFLHDGSNASIISVHRYGASGADTAKHPLFATTNTGAGSPGLAAFSDLTNLRVQARTTTTTVPISSTSSSAVSLGAQQLWVHFVDADNATAADRLKVYADGGADIAANIITDAPSTGNSGYALTIGALGNEAAGLYLNGGVQEFIVYASDQSANRTGIESNIANHYGITI